MQLVSRTTDHVIANDLRIAANYWRRLVGLQFQSALSKNQALLIVPCKSIHTCFMRFSIDIVWLDKEGQVLAIDRDVKPWRVRSAPKGTIAALEMAAGMLPEDVADQWGIVTDGDVKLPNRLHSWQCQLTAAT